MEASLARVYKDVPVITQRDFTKAAVPVTQKLAFMNQGCSDYSRFVVKEIDIRAAEVDSRTKKTMQLATTDYLYGQGTAEGVIARNVPMQYAA